MAIDVQKLRKQLDKQTKKSSSGVGVDAPKKIEIAYGKKLIKEFVTPVTEDIEKALFPTLERDEAFYIANYDTASIQTLIDGVRSQWDDIAETAEKIAAEMAKENNKFNRKKFVSNIKKAVGVDISDILTDSGVEGALETSVAENVALIKDMPQKQLDRIEKVVLQGVDRGDDFFSIKKDLRAIDGISKRRAKVIARDQVSKLNGSLNRIRQEDVGIDSYYWRTSEDEAVRPTHAAHNGKKFRWDSPPSDTGHPGDDIMCRCTADPDLRGLKIVGD